MDEANMSGTQSLGGSDFTPCHALQIANGFRRNHQTLKPLLSDSVFNRPLVSQDFGIRHLHPPFIIPSITVRILRLL